MHGTLGEFIHVLIRRFRADRTCGHNTPRPCPISDQIAGQTALLHFRRRRTIEHTVFRTFQQIETESPEQALRWRKRDPHFVPDGGGESPVVSGSLSSQRQRLLVSQA